MKVWQRFGGFCGMDAGGTILSMDITSARTYLALWVQSTFQNVMIRPGQSAADERAIATPALFSLMMFHVVGVMLPRENTTARPDVPIPFVWTTLDETSRRAILDATFENKFGVVGFCLFQPTYPIAATLGIPFEGAGPFVPAADLHATLPAPEELSGSESEGSDTGSMSLPPVPGD